MTQDSLKPFSSSSSGASSRGLADDEGPASATACAGVTGALLIACRVCQDLSSSSHGSSDNSRMLIIVMHGSHAAACTRRRMRMRLY